MNTPSFNPPMTTTELVFGIALFIIAFVVFLVWANTRPVANARPDSPTLPGVQEDLVGERFWDAETRPALLQLLERLHQLSGETLKELRTSSQADCGNLVLELLPQLVWQMGERYVKVIEGAESRNLGIWYQAQDGRWYRDLKMVRLPTHVSMLGRRVPTLDEAHEKLQLNACLFYKRWHEVAWKPMETLPNDTWVVLQLEGADGEELLVTGFIQSGVRHTMTVYDGELNGCVDADDFPAYGHYLAWAPLLVNNI